MRRYGFIDYATQGYCALVAVLIVVFQGHQVAHWGWRVAAHGLCLALVHGLIVAHAARPANRTLDFLRHFYPVLLYAGFYSETGLLNQMAYTGYLDPVFYRLDEQIFGFAPCFAFMAALPFRGVGELFYGAYFSYYLMIFGVGFALYRHNRAEFDHYISVTSFVFYVCYVTYIFLPVVGPHIFYPELVPFRLPAEAIPPAVPEFPAAIQAGLFFRVMAFLYEHFESPGAAFPSSHVAIALVTVYFSFRYLRAIRWPHLGLAVLLCLATVYCRYHYAVDVVAGVATTLVFLPLGNALYARFGGNAARGRSVP